MYDHIFVAGTFDKFHKGHNALLFEAFFCASYVTIGLTSDAFVQKYKTQKTHTYKERIQELMAWVAKNGLLKRTTIISIDDPYEPAASDPSLEAIIVTRDNKKRGEEINAKRHAHGLQALTLVEVPLTPAEDQKAISSTRIRSHEINRDGRLILPDSLRPELQQPLGKIVATPRASAEIVITCGDMATITLLDMGVVPTIAIVDYHVERKPYARDRTRLQKIFKTHKQIVSGPGYIAKSAIETLDAWGKNPTSLLLEIEGEEDLLTLPAIAAAPQGSILYYGQPGVGLVEVLVTPERQQTVKDLLLRFI